MTPEPAPETSVATPDRAASPSWRLYLSLGLIALGAVVWLVLSVVVVHEGLVDAMSQALGVLLAMLVVLSIVGAVRHRER